MKKFISAILGLAMLLTLVLPAAPASAASPPAGWNKLQDIVIFSGTPSSSDGWAGSGNGALELGSGVVPIDSAVTYNGSYSLRYNISYAPDYWSSIITTNLWWQTSNIERYISDGRLEFDVKGNAGGEAFSIGFQDRVKERSSGEFMEQTVPVTNFTSITTSWKHVSIPLSSIITNPSFDLKQLYTLMVKSANANPMKFWITNVKITSNNTEQSYPPVKVNQVGYAADADKYALVSFFEGDYTAAAGTAFQLKRASDNAVVHSGTLTLSKDYDAYVSGERVLKADFSGYNTPGDYYVQVAGIAQTSRVFKIMGRTGYSDLLKDSLRYFYYQRANTPLTEPYAQGFARPALHMDDQNAPLLSNSSIRKDVSKGWYDAGDFGKYTNPAATAVSDLLWLYETFSTLFPDGQLNIPESGNGKSDLLDEIKYELDFILNMQDGTNGGFYARVYPQNSRTDPRYIDDVSPSGSNVKPITTTANAAAVLAHASMLYGGYDAAYAARLLNAAKSGWTYLENHPENIQTPDGPYDVNDTSEYVNDRFFAAAALYRATGEAKYDNYVKAKYTVFASMFDAPQNGHAIAYMQLIGFFHYMKSANRDAAVTDWFTTKFNYWRNDIITRSQTGTWMNTLDGTVAETDYYWGSNGAALNSVFDIVIGGKVMGDYSAAHLKVAETNLNYILGVNPLSVSYVTGYGTDAKLYPFSNIFSEDGLPAVPKGYMAGGANGYNSYVFSRFHGKAYSDTFTEFASNEHTIYWNSLLAATVAAVQQGLTAEPGDTAPPSVPAGLTATAVSPNQVNLSWTASTDNVGVAGYTVYRNGMPITTVTSGTGFSNTGLAASTAYSYTVAAYDAAGNHSAQSAAANVTTPPGGTGGTSVMVDNNTTGMGEYQFQYGGNWCLIQDSSAAQAYQGNIHLSNYSDASYQVKFTGTQVKIYSIKGPDMGIVAVSIDGGAETMVDAYASTKTYDTLIYTSPVLTSGLHSIKVRLTGNRNTAATGAYGAADRMEVISGGGSAPADTTPPSVPAGLSATAVSPTQVNLSWTASTDNVGVTGYKVYCNGSQIATVNGGTSYSNTGLTASTAYSYTVAAYDEAGNTSARSAAVQATTPASGGSGGTIGYTADGAASETVAAGRITGFRYTASSAMTVSQMKLKVAATATGKIKAALYSDSNGNPGSFLAGTEERSNVAAGWQTFNLTAPYALTSGTAYWLVVWTDAPYAFNCSYQDNAGWKASSAYSASWPGSFPTPASFTSNKFSFYAQ